ncbi:hypothetical protein R1flu_019297 [Riccia fluitans]|uniref:YdbS-like PH domain-containing protein n=1 Tax=Riccia fluitans TaxID=41844 RepID=A0ABD1ZM41_9MARC
MATRAFSSTVAFAPSLFLSSRDHRSGALSQQQRCRILSSRWSHSVDNQSSSFLCRIPKAVQFSSNVSSIQIRGFSKVATRFARSPVAASSAEQEEVFFDGGTHYGDLVSNLIFGLTLVWLPLTLASVFRALFLRYRFTNLRITVMSGLLGEDRKDFSYEVVKEARFVPRFIGEWGDLVIELKDGTLIDLRSVPKFREITAYINERAGQKLADPSVLTSTAPGATSAPKKGFST